MNRKADGTLRGQKPDYLAPEKHGCTNRIKQNFPTFLMIIPKSNTSNNSRCMIQKCLALLIIQLGLRPFRLATDFSSLFCFPCYFQAFALFYSASKLIYVGGFYQLWSLTHFFPYIFFIAGVVFSKTETQYSIIFGKYELPNYASLI